MLRTKVYYIKEQIKIIGKISDKEMDTIKNKDNEKIIIDKLRELYSNKIFTNEELKTQLIMLENRKLCVNSSDFSGLISSGISILLALLAIILTSYNMTIDMEKYANDLIGSVSQKIESIRSDVTVMKNFLQWFPSLMKFVLFITCGLIIYDEMNSIIQRGKMIAINIHKSVIQEQLKKIEEKKQQKIEKSKQKQNEQLILELKEIQKLLKYSNEDKAIISKACNKIINDIF